MQLLIYAPKTKMAPSSWSFCVANHEQYTGITSRITYVPLEEARLQEVFRDSKVE